MNTNLSRKIFFVVFISCLFSLQESKGDSNKLKDALRNNTAIRLKNKNTNVDNQYDEDGNILKSEARHMLKQCCVEKNDSISYDDYGNNHSRQKNYYGEDNYHGSNRKYYSSGDNGGKERERTTYSSYYNDDDRNQFTRNQYVNHKDDKNHGSNGNRAHTETDSLYNSREHQDHNIGSGRSNYYNTRNRQTVDRKSDFDNGYFRNYDNNKSAVRNGWTNSSQDYGEGEKMYGYRRSSPEQTYTQGNAYGSDSNRRTQQGYEGFSQEPFIRRSDSSYSNNFGLNPEQYGNSRLKRHNNYNYKDAEENNDNQCISQCVFGYLQLLDDDRTPSESLVLKWLQEHVTGNDMNRIKALRDARRCFASLTTTDVEDGCEFSTQLTKCLNLDLE